MSQLFRSWIEVSRSRIAANYLAVCNAVGPGVDVCPVVKADAYRHGAVEVARVLCRKGARWLAVSSAEEGVALRRAGVGEPRILVMADFLPFERDSIAEHRLTPVLHSLEDIAQLDRLAERKQASIHYHLKIDSGMGRLGTRATPEEILTAVRASPRVKLEGIMTHFASAADYTRDQSDAQTEYFDAVEGALAAALPERPLAHMSSTIAVAYGRRASWKRLVRPGHAIYGYVSPVRVKAGEAAPPNLLDVKPALSWKAAILAVKDVPAGTRIGYGAMFTADRPMRIGILAAGYADGIPHRLSNKGRVIAAGQFTQILGAVSMDVTTIDLSHAPHMAPGDAVTLLGEEGECSQDAQQMARMAGTISYSLLCGISARVHRVYVD
ncbi:MAG: alanine racemase [Bryobacteraceae bacterium]